MDEKIQQEIEKFQRNLQCIRMLLNLTPEELGNMLNVSRQTVMSLESHKTEMTLIQYIAFKVALRQIFEKMPQSTKDIISNITLGTIGLMAMPLFAPVGIMGLGLAVAGASRIQNKLLKGEKMELLKTFLRDYSTQDETAALDKALSLEDIGIDTDKPNNSKASKD